MAKNLQNKTILNLDLRNVATLSAIERGWVVNQLLYFKPLNYRSIVVLSLILWKDMRKQTYDAEKYGFQPLSDFWTLISVNLNFHW